MLITGTFVPTSNVAVPPRISIGCTWSAACAAGAAAANAAITRVASGKRRFVQFDSISVTSCARAGTSRFVPGAYTRGYPGLPSPVVFGTDPPFHLGFEAHP